MDNIHCLNTAEVLFAKAAALEEAAAEMRKRADLYRNQAIVWLDGKVKDTDSVLPFTLTESLEEAQHRIAEMGIKGGMTK